jgi:hypothetical protein
MKTIIRCNFRHLFCASLLSIFSAISAGESLTSAPVVHDWKDWNSTPTPEEGRRVKDYYDFGEFYCTEAQKFIRTEFDLPADPADAWVVFFSYYNVDSARTGSFVHELFLNDTRVHTYPAPGEIYRRQTALAIVSAKGLRKGRNVFWAATQWSSLKLVANCVDGSQVVVNLSPDWRAASVKHPGWDTPDYNGQSSEMVYRLGREGYHCNLLPFMCHPYVGQIELKKDRKIPVYKTGETARWLVSIPEPFYGLAAPELTFRIARCFDEVGEPLVGKGTRVESEDGRGIYEMSFTVPSVGAYDVEISFGDKPALWRKEELIATGALEQPFIDDARNLMSSLKLTKVDEVDCTDLADKAHELIRGQIKDMPPSGGVVTNAGMEYYETGTGTAFLGGPEKANYAMWKLSPQALNAWHLVEVDIPDDKDRTQIVALVHNIATREYGTESTVELGNPRQPTNGLYTHRMLFLPKFHDVRLMIAPSPARREIPGTAAAKAIRLYRLDDVLPAIRLGGAGRANGTYNERSNLVAVSFYPGSDGIQRFSSLQTFAPYQYRRWFLAIQKHVEYLRFCGHNSVCHGLYQYTKEEYPADENATDYISIMLDMYYANGICFYGNVEYATSNRLEDDRHLGHRLKKMKVTNEEVAAGRDTCRLVSKTGVQAGSFYPLNSPCHPDLRKDVVRIVEDIGNRYGVHPGFKGLMFFAGTMGCALDFGHHDWGFEDVTYNLFKNSVRRDAPDFREPDRFARRQEWISKHASEEWEAFRCERVYQLFRSVASALKFYAPKAKVLVNACAWPWQKNIGAGSVAELERRLRGTGTDVNLFRNDPDMLVLHNDWQGQHITGQELAFVERYNNDPQIWNYVTGGKPCGIFFWTGFYEMTLYFPREMSNPSWYDAAVSSKYGVNIEKRFIGSVGKAGRNYLSPYATAFAYANPVFFANRFTDVAEHRGFVDLRAEIGQAISFIPEGDYNFCPGSTATTVLRRSGTDAYLANNAPRPVTVALVWNPETPGEIRNPILGKPCPVTMENGRMACRFELLPYQLLPLRVEGASALRLLILDGGIPAELTGTAVREKPEN